MGRWIGALMEAIVLAAGALGYGVARRIGGRVKAPAGAAMVLLATPAGASADLDGKRLVETTPTMVSALAPGMHTWLHHADFDDVERRVRIGAGERVAIEVALSPQSREVEVTVGVAAS